MQMSKIKKKKKKKKKTNWFTNTHNTFKVMPNFLNHSNKGSEEYFLITKQEFRFNKLSHTKNKSMNKKAVVQTAIKIHSLKLSTL